jgi:hypothetical protein
VQLVAEDYHRLGRPLDPGGSENPGEEASMSVRDPNELPHLFAERASCGSLEGLLELYESEATLIGPDGEQARRAPPSTRSGSAVSASSAALAWETTPSPSAVTSTMNSRPFRCTFMVILLSGICEL